MTDVAVPHSSTAEGTVRRAAAGDEAAFARLIAEHNGVMARVAYVILGDREMTLDAVQSAWSIAWRRIGSVRQPAQIRSWLVAIAANEARQQMRRKRRAVVVDISNAIDRHGNDDLGESAAVIDLGRALRRLAVEDRRLLSLRFVAGLDSTEIAQHLGLSASGVRSRLSRLIERLRSDLETEEGFRK